MRTLESEAVCETSLPALLNVALSAPKALPPDAAPLFVGCVAAGVAALVPKSDFNPSRLLRMSIALYSLPGSSASLLITLVIYEG
jgi:hypothetical protein